MNLRARLILAFLALSVLPLTAVTLYSYRSSIDAMRLTAESEARMLAREMTGRMDAVTRDIGQRIEQIWKLPPATPKPSAPDAQRTADSVRAALSEAAGLVDRLEFVASGAGEPPPSAEAQRGSRAGTRPASPAPPSPPPPPGKVVIDVSKLSWDAGGAAQDAAAREEIFRQRAEAMRFLQQLVAAGLKAGATDTAKALAEEAAQALKERNRGRRESSATPGPPPEALQQIRVSSPSWRGKALGLPVTRDGRVIGTVNATVKFDRVLGEVFAATRRGEGEIPFALDPGQTIHTPRPADRTRLSALGLAALAGTDQVLRRSGPDSDWLVVTRHDPSGTTFGIARPLGEPLREIRNTAGRNLALGLSLVGLALVGIIPLSGRMTRNLNTLTAGAVAISRGNLQTRVPVRSLDEFGQLAAAFNQMAGELEAKQKALVAQERLQRELELCRQIQNEMLPSQPLLLDLAEVRGVSIPAREVGGDFFNYFVLDDDQLALLVGDVAGKGVGAALLMANIQATLRARLPLERDLAKLADAIDREMEQNTPRSVFLTLFVAILDTRRRTLRYVNAGHNPQFVLRAGGGIEQLPSTGLPVGMFAGHGYEERSVEIADGDLLFFYTDGMVEVENEAGDVFDIERLEALLLAEHRDEIDTLLARVEAAVGAFRGTAEALDDATMMALRFGGARPASPVRPV